jgi:hypothetical protein
VLVDPAAELTALMGSLANSLVVVANNSLSNESSEVILGVPADTLNGESDVGSRHGIISDTDIRAHEVSLLLGAEVGTGLGTAGGETGEVLLSKLNKLLVGDTTGSNENHAVSSVVVLDVVGKLGSGDVADVLARAENGAAKGLVLESSSVEVIENNLLDLLLNLLGLSEDNVALTLDGGLLELGVLENIGENVDALRNIRVESLGEVDGVLALEVC